MNVCFCSIKTGKLAADECDQVHCDISNTSSRDAISSSYALAEVAEVAEDSEEADADDDHCPDCGKPPIPPKTSKTDIFKSPNVKEEGPLYKWRIDLSKTEKFWTGWFKGLSQKFLDIRIPKLLLLANIHGLDTTLTVGQMQGKMSQGNVLKLYLSPSL